ncbi:MAG: MtrAB system histidine kinase MtrB [Kocuria sp.]|nr:MtrAB system histidine kinase MtrB [Kocuria sp.]
MAKRSDHEPVGGTGPAVSSGRRRHRGPLRMLRFRAGLLVRRWRQSLQFRAVTIAMIGALVIFLVTGAFLSHQISERLFSDRLEQVLTQAETDFTQVQASFDASDAADRGQLQTMVTATLDALDSDTTTSQRRWVIIPLSSETGQSMLPAQAESDWMGEDTVPQDLQDRVSADGRTYWQSSSVAMDDGGQQVPVVIVGQAVEPQPGARYGLYLVNDFSQPQRTLDAIHAVLILSTVVQALLVSGVVGYVTREVVRPVSTTARVSESLADGNLGVRMQVEGSHEVARLGRSFNRMADNLEDQITRLEQLSSMQQTFVSDVSHELRTPLTTVRMAAEVLHNAREEFDPVNRRSAELLYNQVDRFDTLLADLLEISRFDAGAARLEISGVNIFALVNEVLEATAPLVANSGSVIRVHSDLQRCIVQVDQRRIDRILRNLLVNALEHGEGRPIDVVVKASEVAVGIAVRDHGIGMTEEQTRKVFDRFWRADPARARTTGGTGLGLSIAVEDTRLHGGRLDAWGAPGQGACFRLTLPLLRSRPLNGDDPSPVHLPPYGDELPSVAVVTDTGTFAAVPLDRDSVIAPTTETIPVIQAEVPEAAILDVATARTPVLRPAIGGEFLANTAVNEDAVDMAGPESGIAQEEYDDLDEAYEDLYLDDTGELPAFRRTGPAHRAQGTDTSIGRNRDR